MAEAVAAELAAAETGGTGGGQNAVTDEHLYQDPASLKWKIFEAVAKANGQRAFETYWSALRDFMHGWLPRGGLDEALDASLGADNLHLHNELILCLLNNARCRYLPADLVSQVPASFRGKVVHTTAAAPPAAAAAAAAAAEKPPPAAIPRRPVPVLNGSNSGSSPCGKSGLSNGSGGGGGNDAIAAAAAASLPFQGKRAEGLLLNAEGYAVDGSGLSAAPVKTEFGSGAKPATQAPGVAKLETTAARSGLTSAVAPSAGDDAVSSPGGERRRDDDRIPRGERGGVDCLVEAELLSRDAQLLEDEIEASFGTGSDLWHPWSSREEWGSGRLERSSSQGVKRPAPLSQETNSTGCYANERDTKSLKTEGGVAAAGGGGSAANGALYCPEPRSTTREMKGAAPALEQAAARAAAEQLSPSHRSQRVPGARALAPFLQAVTASQKMKVSHEVCRVMTAGVKEYLRRIIEACLVNARDGRRRGKVEVKAGVRGIAPAANPSKASNGAVAPPPGGVKKQVGAASPGATTPTAAATLMSPPAPAPAARGVGGGGSGGGVLTPGHLQSALETTPRLVGPPSSTRAQWRRVATYAAAGGGVPQLPGTGVRGIGWSFVPPSFY
ncbi:hypothetical protein Esi_0137_0092 [Ectocarpus siliculosus]|uniref:Uncharacterized protein n=1 Tax=Ectocarpus siliculosus TaxID=2880 RepID=D8LER5_ECTSI|nr:hypothetical protein Esi_0137_0092 [Ectocarpus siliculosus]|eukprot:CBN78628.1 hypothetical protein Esi_0137_0092 [Ectocarpus siliculosus]